MKTDLILYFKETIGSSELLILIISMLPVVELRGSIPWGILVEDLSWQKSLTISLFGNFIISVPILTILDPLRIYFSKFKYFNTLIIFIDKRSLKKSKIIKKYGHLGLIIFVGIPMPITGVWTGCVASNLLKINKYKAMISIFFGLILSSIITTKLTLMGYYYLG